MQDMPAVGPPSRSALERLSAPRDFGIQLRRRRRRTRTHAPASAAIALTGTEMNRTMSSTLAELGLELAARELHAERADGCLLGTAAPLDVGDVVHDVLVDA